MMRRLNTPWAQDIRNIIVAEAGLWTSNKSDHMNTSPFSLANRKQLADMLKSDYEGLRYKAKRRLQERRTSLEKSIIKEYAEKRGALKLIALIQAAQTKLKNQERDLTELGFRTDDGDVVFTYNGRDLYAKSLEERLDKEIGTCNDIDARFDSVQLAMMTVASLEDAEKLLKSVSEV